jgi:hypothetical protein
MITLVHCKISDSMGQAINGFPKTSDCIFSDCYQAIDNRDDLLNPRLATAQLFNHTYLAGSTANQFNLYIRIQNTALLYGDHANGIERHIRRNTFVDCETAVDRRDARFDSHPEAFTAISITYTQVNDNIFDGCSYSIRQNYALVSEDYNLLNGAITGTVIRGTNSIGPGYVPRYLGEEVENYRLERAGVVGLGGLRPLISSPGALAGSTDVDIGGYHREDSAGSLYSRMIRIDSPNLPTVASRAINSEIADGFGFVNGGTLGQANVYELNYSDNELGHTRIAALHAFRAIRNSTSSISFARTTELQLQTPEPLAQHIRDNAADYAAWQALFRADPVLEPARFAFYHIESQFRTNANRPNQVRFKARVLVYANMPSRFHAEWFIGCILLAGPGPFTIFSSYNTTGNRSPTGVGYPNFYVISETDFHEISSAPFTNKDVYILDPLYAPQTYLPTTNLTGSFVRAEWFGVVEIEPINGEFVANLRGIDTIPDAYPGMYDGFVLSLSYAAFIEAQLALAITHIPISPAAIPWYTGDQWLLSNEKIAFRLQSLEDGSIYENRYKLEPIGVENPFANPNLTALQLTIIQNSLFVAGIWNQFVIPSYDELSSTSDAQREMWLQNGGHYIPTPTITRERTSRSASGVSEKLIQTGAPRQVWPFARG